MSPFLIACGLILTFAAGLALCLLIDGRSEVLPGHCDICGLGIAEDDMCLSDVDLGICHAACLEGSPVVSLDTGEPLPEGTPGPVPYRYGDI